MLNSHKDVDRRRVVCLVAAASASRDTLPALSLRYRQCANWLSPARALDIGPLEEDRLGSVIADIDAAIAGQPIDKFIMPVTDRRKRLLASDMDSTLITIECIDELAALVGRKVEIAAITERAMAGELDFNHSLVERVRCLAGTRIEAVHAICRDKVVLSPGAGELVATMRAHGARTVLVSGGFRSFTRYVASLLGMDIDFANELEMAAGQLTGRVIEPIFGPQEKRRVLLDQCQKWGIDAALTMAVGDGANDIPMIETAGIGAAYRAKRRLRDRADLVIDHTSLRSLLYAQGYADTDIVESTISLESELQQNGDLPCG